MFCDINLILIFLQVQSGVFAFSFGSDNRRARLEQVKFVYYPKPFEPHEICLDDGSSLRSSYFKKGVPTVFLIDGFRSNGSTPMYRSLTQTFLNHGNDQNVIVVDWTSLSGFSENTETEGILVSTFRFLQTLGNLRDVGSRVADFIHFLHTQMGVPYSHNYVIGMSLGAHIAGATGTKVMERYGGQIGRITGLDPATTLLPLDIIRVRRGAAAFVDIYHTNRGTLGEKDERTGDINVYVNGGAAQPGCESRDRLGSGILPGICSHTYAWKLLDATFQREFLACPCVRDECLCQSNCNNRCSDPIPIGITAAFGSIGTYHINTETKRYF